MEDIKSFFKNIYQYFNERNIELVIDNMTDDVQWANGMEGGHVHGHDEVRNYWTRQFGIFNPNVDPVSIEPDDQGRWVVEVHQVVRDLQSNLLLDTTVYHTYQFRDGLIVRMDISQPPTQSGEDE